MEKQPLSKRFPVSLTAQQAIQNLQKRGADPTLDEVICLHELGKRIENPIGDEARFYSGNPVLCGNVWLWPFTIGASIWWQDACEMFSEQDNVFIYSLPFALHHSRNAEYLQSLTTHKVIKKAVKEFCKKLSVTRKELDYALNSLFKDDIYAEIKAEEKSKIPQIEQSADMSEAVALLCTWFEGTTPHYWTWEESRDRALHLFFIAKRQESANDNTISSLDPISQAVHVFTMAKNEIALAHGLEV